MEGCWSVISPGINHPFAVAQIIQIGNVIRIQIKVRNPWEIRAGQYIYLWAPGVNFWSTFESHPFMISWWDHGLDGKGSNIYLLVKPKSGFT